MFCKRGLSEGCYLVEHALNFFSDFSDTNLCNEQCISQNLSCNGICAPGRKLCGSECLKEERSCFGRCFRSYHIPLCDGTCFPEYNFRYLSEEKKTYLCNGECVHYSHPCDGKCIDGSLYFCDGKCLKSCLGQCYLNKFLNSNGTWLIISNETIYQTYMCNGQCYHQSVPCHGKCLDRSLSLCDGVCLKSCLGQCHEVNFFSINGTWINWSVQTNNQTYKCNGHCYHQSVPCNGVCVSGFYLCNDVCLKNGDICNDQCEEGILGCDGSCSNENYQRSFMCNGECIQFPKSCNGKCHPVMKECQGYCSDLSNYCDKKCGRSVLGCDYKCKGAIDIERQYSVYDTYSSTTYICNGECQNLSSPCNGTCHSFFHLCEGKCISKYLKCNDDCHYEHPYAGVDGKCHKKSLNLYQIDFNFDKKDQLYMCKNQLQSVNIPCTGHCPKDHIKCPDENLCLHVQDICSTHGLVASISSTPPNPNKKVKCKGQAQYSKAFCKNLMLKDENDNCEYFQDLNEYIFDNQTESKMISCPGKKTYQCIPKQNLCDGVINCLDRSDESMCKSNILASKPVNFSIFIECSMSNGEAGFSCTPELCIPLVSWCNNNYDNWINVTHKCPELVQSMYNIHLCRNLTFWQYLPCNGKKRCLGEYPGQCEKHPETKCYGIQSTQFCKSHSGEACKSRDIDKNFIYSYEDLSPRFELNRNTPDTFLNICDKDFMFDCKTNGFCIHNDAVCDGYPQCPDGSDEYLNICLKCPKKFGYPAHKISQATFSCIHRYTKRWICAVPCDGEDDLCEDYADEDCKLPASYNQLMILAAILVAFLIIISMQILLLLNKKIQQDNLKTKTETSPMHILEKRCIKNSFLIDLIKFVELQSSSEEIKSSAVKLLKMENEIHGFEIQGVILCFKKYFKTTSITQTLFNLLKPKSKFQFEEFFRKINPLSKCNSTTIIRLKYAAAFIKVFQHSFDLVKDLVLIVFYGKFAAIFFYSTEPLVPEVSIFFLLLLSISIPPIINFFVLMNCLNIPVSNTLKFIWAYFALFAPSFSALATAKSENKMRKQKHNIAKISATDFMYKQIILEEKKVLNWQKTHALLRATEACIEFPMQGILILIIASLILSETSTTGSNKAMWSEENFALFVTSGFWSLISVALSGVANLVADKNGFLSMKAKIVFFIFYLFGICQRIGAVLLFFAPSLGLFNLLYHWKMGKIPLQQTQLFYDVNATTHEHIYFSEIWKPIDDYTDLTLISLGTAFICFLVSLLLHFFCVLLVKQKVNKIAKL